MSFGEWLCDAFAAEPDSVELQRRNTAPAGAQASGVEIVYGRYDYEKTDALRNPNTRWDVYTRMENDARVKAMLRAIELPLQTGAWEFKAADENDPGQVELAELCSCNLLGKTTDRYGEAFLQRTPWKAQRLPELLRMLAHGFSLNVGTQHVVNDGGRMRRVFSRMQWLEPETLSDSTRPWEIDPRNDDIVGVRRSYLRPDGIDYEIDEWIPASRLFLYVWDMKGARYEGNAFIRPMYGAWFRKDFVQKRQLLWTQKAAAGAPIGSYPPNMGKDQIAQFQEFVRATRGVAADRAYGSFPMDADGNRAEVNYVGTQHGDIDRTTSLTDAENREIAQVGGQKAMALGEGGSSGNRALGQTQAGIEQLQLDAVVEVLTTWITFGCANLRSEVERLREWNFPQVSALPRLIFTKPDPNRANRSGDEFLKGVEKGLVPITPAVRQQFTERHGYEIADESEYEIDETTQPTPSEGNGPTQPPSGGEGDPDEDGSSEGDDENGRRAASSVRLAARDRMRERLAPLLEPVGGAGVPAGGFRPPNEFEARFVNLQAISKTQRDAIADTAAVMRDISDRMVADLFRRLESGKITRRNLPTQRRSRFRGTKRAEADLAAVHTETGETGMVHVEAELDAQETRDG